MKMDITRHSIQIIPECKLDEAFLEEVLGLKEKGDTVPARRVAVMAIDTAFAYMEISKEECDDYGSA